ncbi:50S ribosomal protein L25 [Clostridium tetanomorphum]|uniref:Large ribosomal subunit protein bL25 n=1 Tax=Clostridium tetanomorphum TaxID=1553 RepID=A0A923E883_CLOTT|nr:50S ribosomal protein L25 [Clostridium tetanomorphum]MBC2396951.1 50S ribosomal protein L25 [Clostridium tetanomorphum]NRZ97405.1 large subunit ribosomal protein L25 [Clostridium tetanomorphum]
MEGTINAFARSEKARIARREGFIPGVVYGKDVKNMPVKFERNKLLNFLKEKGEKAKINFLLNNEKKQGIIKEVERDLATTEIIHIDIQAITEKENVKWTVPVDFLGKDLLKNRDLYIQVYNSDVEVEGDSSKIPNKVKIEVNNMKFGEEIKIKDLNLDPSIKLLKDPETVIAVITNS